jgi:hypothetical protein
MRDLGAATIGAGTIIMGLGAIPPHSCPVN